ncbi:type II secretion system F family protein [Vibrio sp. AK197]
MPQDATLFFVLLFFAVVFISQALILPAAGSKAKHKQLSERLKETQNSLDEEARSILNEQYLKNLSPLDRKLVAFKWFSVLKKNIELSGLDWTISQTISVTMIISISSSVLLFLLNQPFYTSIASFIFTWVSLHFYLQKRIARRLSLFEEQLPDALDIMRRMLQAGQPVTQTFNEVGSEMADPIGVEFKNTFNLLNYGYDMRLAIMQMAERTPTVSMLAFASAILLQKETGGNLSENLEKVSHLLRARFKLQRKIKTISAESRLSAWILVLSPFGLFVMLWFTNSNYVEPLYSTTNGMNMVGFGLICLFLGSLWIRNIINFEV